MVTVSTNDRSHVVRIERPGIDWIPLRKAPFHFQAAYSRHRGLSSPPHPCPLSSELIDATVGQMVIDRSIIKCEVDRDEYGTGFLLSFDDWEPDPYDESALSRTIAHRFVQPFALPEDLKRDQAQLAVLITRAWNMMEFRFRRAVKVGYCRLFARCGAAYAPIFSELTPEIIAQYRIIDWEKGVAESIVTPGDRLYEIYAEAVSSPSLVEKSISPKHLSHIISDHPDPDDPLFVTGISAAEGRPSRVSTVPELLNGHGSRVLLIARHFFYNQNDEPIGEVIPQGVKNKLTDVLGSACDPRTVKAGLRLARDLRAINAVPELLAEHGFNKA